MRESEQQEKTEIKRDSVSIVREVKEALWR